MVRRFAAVAARVATVARRVSIDSDLPGLVIGADLSSASGAAQAAEALLELFGLPRGDHGAPLSYQSSGYTTTRASRLRPCALVNSSGDCTVEAVIAEIAERRCVPGGVAINSFALGLRRASVSKQAGEPRPRYRVRGIRFSTPPRGPHILLYSLRNNWERAPQGCSIGEYPIRAAGILFSDPASKGAHAA